MTDIIVAKGTLVLLLVPVSLSRNYDMLMLRIITFTVILSFRSVKWVGMVVKTLISKRCFKKEGAQRDSFLFGVGYGHAPKKPMHCSVGSK